MDSARAWRTQSPRTHALTEHRRALKPTTGRATDHAANAPWAAAAAAGGRPRWKCGARAPAHAPRPHGGSVCNSPHLHTHATRPHRHRHDRGNRIRAPERADASSRGRTPPPAAHAPCARANGRATARGGRRAASRHKCTQLPCMSAQSSVHYRTAQRERESTAPEPNKLKPTRGSAPA